MPLRYQLNVLLSHNEPLDSVFQKFRLSDVAGHS